MIEDLRKGEYLLKSIEWAHDSEYQWLIFIRPGHPKWECTFETSLYTGETGCTATKRRIEEELGYIIDDKLTEQIDTYHILNTEISSTPYLREVYVLTIMDRAFSKQGIETRWVSSELLFKMIQTSNLDIGLNAMITQDRKWDNRRRNQL